MLTKINFVLIDRANKWLNESGAFNAVSGLREKEDLVSDTMSYIFPTYYRKF